MHEIWFFAWCIMNAWNFLLNMNFENTCLNAWNLIFCSLFFFLMVHSWKNEIFYSVWILNLNENACLNTYNLIFSVLLEECIYEYMKVWLNMNFRFQWKCMFECMKFDFLFFLKNAYINSWNCEFFEWKCMLECMNFFCLFDLFFFLECIYKCVKFCEFSE